MGSAGSVGVQPATAMLYHIEAPLTFRWDHWVKRGLVACAVCPEVQVLRNSLVIWEATEAESRSAATTINYNMNFYRLPHNFGYTADESHWTSNHILRINAALGHWRGPRRIGTIDAFQKFVQILRNTDHPEVLIFFVLTR
jgi:hypothetical protein